MDSTFRLEFENSKTSTFTMGNWTRFSVWALLGRTNSPVSRVFGIINQVKTRLYGSSLILAASLLFVRKRLRRSNPWLYHCECTYYRHLPLNSHCAFVHVNLWRTFRSLTIHQNRRTFGFLCTIIPRRGRDSIVESITGRTRLFHRWLCSCYLIFITGTDKPDKLKVSWKSRLIRWKSSNCPVSSTGIIQVRRFHLTLQCKRLMEEFGKNSFEMFNFYILLTLLRTRSFFTSFDRRLWYLRFITII